MTKIKQGFTLVELLTVIAVISVVFSMLLPVFNRAQNLVKNSVCLNNLRQWGVGTMLFITDNNDYLPKDGAPNGRSRNHGWYVDLPLVMGIKVYAAQVWRTNSSKMPNKSTWLCPANVRVSNGVNLFHYCLNGYVNGIGANNRVKHSSIFEPSKTVWLFDNGKLAAVARQNNVHTNVHSAGGQFLFLDGHGTRFRSDMFWNYKKNKGKTNFHNLVWIPRRN